MVDLLNLARYFTHGILFTISMIVLDVVWVLVLADLGLVGLIVGLVIAFAVLFYLMAYVNIALTRYFWAVDVESNIIGRVFHGLTLFIVLFIVDIPGLWIMVSADNLFVSGVMFVLYCFLFGFIAKKVAMIGE